MISLTILSLNTFSQTATTSNKDSVVVLPAKVAKLVAKDLVAYDGLKVEHKATLDLLANTEAKVNTQSSIIKQYEIKDGQWKQMTKNYDTQITAYKNMTDALQKDLRKTKVKAFWGKLKSLVVGVAAGVALGTIIQ